MKFHFWVFDKKDLTFFKITVSERGEQETRIFDPVPVKLCLLAVVRLVFAESCLLAAIGRIFGMSPRPNLLLSRGKLTALENMNSTRCIQP